MNQSLRHITAWLVLALYLPLAVALPMLHTHGTGAAFSGVLSYTTGDDAHAVHGHHDDCFACKFTSSHSLPAVAQYAVLSTGVLPSSGVPAQWFSSASFSPHAPRAPPAMS